MNPPQSSIAQPAPPSAVSPVAWAVALGIVALACAWVPVLLGGVGQPWRVHGLAVACVLGAVALWLAAQPEPTAPAGHRLDEARQAELQEREARWSARTAMSADWYWQSDAHLRITWVSEDLASVFKLGMPPEALLGRTFSEVPELGTPELAGSAEGSWEKLHVLALRHKDWREVIVPVKRAGKPLAWVALNARARFTPDQVFDGYDGVGRDVSEQHLASTRLADSESRLALMNALSADWYWETDENHRLVEFGPVLRQMLGERADKAVGRTHWQAFRYGASDEEWNAHKDDVRAHRPFRDFVFAIRGKGVRWVSLSGRPRHDTKGAVVGYHGVGRDITLAKRAERMLLQRNRELEHLVQARTAALEQTNRDLEGFARHIAHELRTPIGHVAGLAELIVKRAGDRLSTQEREWLQLQQNAAREMSHTVTALLELARSAATEVLFEQVDLSLLARSVVTELPVHERAAPLHWHVQDGLAARCSSTLLRVVLVNLLSNAAKFTRDTPEPKVVVGVEADGRTFYVQDNGIGFDAQQASKLFQPFARLHSSKEFPGTGLGLSIVRRIVERHGGSIAAEGAPGAGARISFTLGAEPQPTHTGHADGNELDDFGDGIDAVEVRAEGVEADTEKSLTGAPRES